MRNLFKIILFIALPLWAFTQTSPEGFIKYKFLKRSGGYLIGEIIEKKVDKPYRIKLDNGIVIEIADYEIMNVKPVRLDRNNAIHIIHQVHEYKWGFHTGAMLVSSSSQNINNPKSAIAAEVAMNRYLSPYVSVGMGIGIYNYDLNARRLLFPIFAQSKLRLYQNQSTPILNLELGYGLATKNYLSGLKEKNGGIFFNPSFGYELGTMNKVSWILSLGVLIQKAYYSYENGTTFADENMVFKRTVLKLGLEFH